MIHLPPKIFQWVFFVHVLGLEGDKASSKSVKYVFLKYILLRKDTNPIPYLKHSLVFIIMFELDFFNSQA